MKIKTCSECGFQGSMWKSKPLLCKSCANKPKVGEVYKSNEVSYENGRPYYPTYRITSVSPSSTKPVQSNTKKEKSLPDLLKLATIVFNKWVRERDSGNGYFNCICCDEVFKTTEMDAAHYFNAGNHSATRFDEDNVHGCCIECNRFLDGNLKEYQLNLYNKIGYQRLGALALKARCVYKWDKEQLLEIIKKYK